ncbi:MULTISPECIES: hypothetical protein [unclassified Nocardiopsis]|uniref:hypothetical protein n=1 Tax=Nocardiopsis TaxID=2013 RepID=UPI00387ADCD7
MRHVSVFCGVLAALLAAGLAVDEGASVLIVAILAAASGYVALVAADTWRRHRAAIRRNTKRLFRPETVARRSRTGKGRHR